MERHKLKDMIARVYLQYGYRRIICGTLDNFYSSIKQLS